MATIHVYLHHTSARIWADADIEPPQVNWLNSIGGATYVPTHDVAAHRAGRRHECTRVRSAREFRGYIEDLDVARRTIADQYSGHTIVWEAPHEW